jgi:hypothetical protein
MAKRTIVYENGKGGTTAYDFESSMTAEELLREALSRGAIAIPVGAAQRTDVNMDKAQRPGFLLTSRIISIW